MILSLLAVYVFNLSREESADGSKADATSTAIAFLCTAIAVDALLTVTALVSSLSPLPKRSAGPRLLRAIVVGLLAPLLSCLFSMCAPVQQ